MTTNAPGYFRGQRIVSDQVGPGELTVVWRELERVLQKNIPGDIVEFGCYTGTTSLFIRRLLDEQGESEHRAFHVYDSFAGLPEKGEQDQSPAGTDFQAGQLSAAKKILLHHFHAAHLQPPVIHKAWFGELTERDVPAQLAFALLDGDFYHSILDSLRLVWPRLSPGGVVLIDDYKREALPGVERAVQDFFGQQNAVLETIQMEHQIAILHK